MSVSTNGGERIDNLCGRIVSLAFHHVVQLEHSPRASAGGHRATHAISASKKSPHKHSSSAFGSQPACTALSFQQSCWALVSRDRPSSTVESAYRALSRSIGICLRDWRRDRHNSHTEHHGNKEGTHSVSIKKSGGLKPICVVGGRIRDPQRSEVIDKYTMRARSYTRLCAPNDFYAAAFMRYVSKFRQPLQATRHCVTVVWHEP